MEQRTKKRYEARTSAAMAEGERRYDEFKTYHEKNSPVTCEIKMFLHKREEGQYPEEPSTMFARQITLIGFGDNRLPEGASLLDSEPWRLTLWRQLQAHMEKVAGIMFAVASEPDRDKIARSFAVDPFRMNVEMTDKPKKEGGDA